MKESKVVDIIGRVEDLPKIEEAMHAEGWYLTEWTEEDDSVADEATRHLVLTFERDTSEASSPGVFASDFISGIPTLLGQLLRVSSLVERSIEVSSGEPAMVALRHLHLALFRKWLAQTLEFRKADVDKYLSESGRFRHAATHEWLDLGTYRNMIPLDADPAERELFAADFEALVMLWAVRMGIR